MARIRSVHPDLCVSESMARQPAEVERTYVRLWTHCDDYGVCVDNVKLIKAAIYPLHDDMTLEVVDDHLNRLVAGEHLIGYEVDGKAFLQVREWAKYQHPQRPSKQKLPGYDTSATRTRVPLSVPGGDMEGDWTEGSRRGDCADTSATVPPPTKPSYLGLAPNPAALSAARAVLEAK